MSKRTRDDQSKDVRLQGDETTPPRLSEQLIAQLQQAVSAAQRRRNRAPVETPDIHPADKDP